MRIDILLVPVSVTKVPGDAKSGYRALRSNSKREAEASPECCVAHGDGSEAKDALEFFVYGASL